jgi:hypothetical protein
LRACGNVSRLVECACSSLDSLVPNDGAISYEQASVAAALLARNA